MTHSRRSPAALVCAGVAFLGGIAAESRQSTPRVPLYELRIWTAAPGRLADLQALFRERAAAALRGHQATPLLCATVLQGATSDGDRAQHMLIDIVTHESRADAERSWVALEGDSEWRAAWSTAEKKGPLLSRPPESTLMLLTDFSPALQPPDSTASGDGRVFELRKYNTGPEGLEYTVERFRLGLAKVLSDSGMTPLAFWTADDRSAFVYLVAHRDREAAPTSWTSFMSGYRSFMAKYNAERGVTTTPGRRSLDDNRMLVPTDYSPLR